MAQTKDPVCGMDVDAAKAAHRSHYQGREYVFCSAGCKQKFDANPQQYAGSETAGRAS
jgi:P-type Cu+ transporter